MYVEILQNRITGAGKDSFLKIKKFKIDTQYITFMIIIRLKDTIIKEELPGWVHVCTISKVVDISVRGSSIDIEA